MEQTIICVVNFSIIILIQNLVTCCLVQMRFSCTINTKAHVCWFLPIKCMPDGLIYPSPLPRHHSLRHYHYRRSGRHLTLLIYIHAHTKCTCIIPVNCPAFPEVVVRPTLFHPPKFVLTHHPPLTSCKPHESRTVIIVSSSPLQPARSLDASRRTLTVLSEFSIMT